MTRTVVAGCLLLAWPLGEARAQDKGPAVTISLGARQARAVPHRQGFTHTGGGNIDVAQPAPDTLVITLTGVAVAGAHPCKDSSAALAFEVAQAFTVSFDKPEVKKAKLTLEGRLVGLLRSHRGGGSARVGPGHAAVSCGAVALASLALPGQCAAGGENLSVNDREGPVSVPVAAGEHSLHQTFTVSAAHPRTFKLCKGASAEFAPDPALDPLWISHWEPFRGAAKKDFGFQVTLKVAAE